MTEDSVRLTIGHDMTAAEPGRLPVAPLAMPTQRLEPEASWLRDALMAPLRVFNTRSREV